MSTSSIPRRTVWVAKQHAVPPAPPAALSRRAAAHYIGGLSEKTLANWAAQGIGPRFRRLGRVHARTVYLVSDLDLWLSSQAEG